MCCISCISVLSVVSIISAADIKYRNNVSKEWHLTDVIIPEISNVNIDITVTEIQMQSYHENEEQIESVANLPNLSEVYIQNVGQEVVPTFINVTNLKVINLYRNKINFVKKEAFGSTSAEIVEISLNEITYIEREAYGSNVRRVSLFCNKLRSISPAWFKTPSKLEDFSIGGNQITVIQENLFKEFTALKTISLSHNLITTIGNGAFANGNNFSSFFINHNNLTEFPATLFSEGNITVEFSFDISYNNLTFLSQELLKKVHVGHAAVIRGNPWQCPCYDAIRDWVQWKLYGGKNYERDPEGEPRCVAARSFAFQCVYYVDYELIQTFREGASPPPLNAEQNCRCTSKGYGSYLDYCVKNNLHL